MPSETSVKFVNKGAILQEFNVAGKNIVLGFNDEKEYNDNPAYFGATIGRFANRLKNAQIDSCAGSSWTLAANNGVNALHGGPTGWHTKEFQGPKPFLKDGVESVEFSYVSPHLDEGYPGEVEVKVIYTAGEVEDQGIKKVRLEIEYEARLSAASAVDETVVNLTNHSYFNIGDQSTIEGTVATLASADHLAVDAGGIAEGAIAPYPGVSANTPFTLGAVDPDIDDCFVFATPAPSAVPLDTRAEPLRVCAAFAHPETKLHLVVKSTEPAFQFYTGKYIDAQARADGSPARGARAGFCVEPSRYVNAANVKEWEGQVKLRKGEVYGSKIVYEAWKEE